jgi:hypothetical protein
MGPICSGLPVVPYASPYDNFEYSRPMAIDSLMLIRMQSISAFYSSVTLRYVKKKKDMT